MTQDEKYTEQFKKALNEYIELGFNQDECNGFMHGFHKGAEAKQLILSSVGSSGSEFEKDLFKLINNYCKNGLKKPELVKKMEWVLGSCKMS